MLVGERPNHGEGPLLWGSVSCEMERGWELVEGRAARNGFHFGKKFNRLGFLLQKATCVPLRLPRVKTSHNQNPDR